MAKTNTKSQTKPKTRLTTRFGHMMRWFKRSAKNMSIETAPVLDGGVDIDGPLAKSETSVSETPARKEKMTREEREKNKLEKKVNRMKSGSLDMDTLDEQARKNLGYSKDKEIIYIE